MKDKKYKYSEIFGNTIQGEGFYTGRSTCWIRFWGCNFSCMSFGQSHLPIEMQNLDPYKDINPDDYTNVEELPVFNIGCDSGYSWSKKFSKFTKSDNVEDIVTKIENFLPYGKFENPKTNQWQHMAFTGGEPIISQNAIIDILKEFSNRDNLPKFVTIETNGTQKLKQSFVDYISTVYPVISSKNTNELFWSVSPKLSSSGESLTKSICPDIVKSYFDISNSGQLKYVSDGSESSWKEIEESTKKYRDMGIDWDVWIMPVGATKEDQENIQAKITEEAVNRGYYVSARVHTWIFGNAIGK